MLDLSTLIKYYSREDIAKELVFGATNRELGVRYLTGGYGKRPDVLLHEADVYEFAKQRISSFHISEEHWKNPLALHTGLMKKEIAKLRTGWDLILDIDCVDWTLSKRITFVFIKILKKHGISNISCKFSGNKGFHIGVPGAAFPDEVGGEPIHAFFPDGVKRVLDYLTHIAATEYSEEIIKDYTLKELSLALDLPQSELVSTTCASCGKLQQEQGPVTYLYPCERCGHLNKKDQFHEYITCEKCSSPLSFQKQHQKKRTCPHCNSDKFTRSLNIERVLGLDTVLISQRHLYRMAYSLHEKSGLASLPINPFSVLAFEKEAAHPEKIKVTRRFLDTTQTVAGEGAELLLKSLDFKPVLKEDSISDSDKERYVSSEKLDEITEKIPVELFPPCIHNILKGIKDGKKRALFVLVNFLRCAGWSYDEIDVILHEWNKKNLEPLREVYLKGHLRYHKQQNALILPPNYTNKMYYEDLGVLTDEDFWAGSKNPVSYAKKRMKNFQEIQQKKEKAEKRKKKQEEKEEKEQKKQKEQMQHQKQQQQEEQQEEQQRIEEKEKKSK